MTHSPDKLTEIWNDVVYLRSAEFGIQLNLALIHLVSTQVDYVRPAYRHLWSEEHPNFGLCYPISEYLHHRLQKLAQPQILPTLEGFHRYLSLSLLFPGEAPLDLAQDAEYDYAQGKGKSFMTPYLSKRGQLLKVRLEQNFATMEQ